MKKIQSMDLLNELQADTRELILKTKSYMKENHSMLSVQPAPAKWSVAQVIWHLNSYGKYYLPEIEKAISEAEHHQEHSNGWFKPGWLGDYFTKLMQPSENGDRKKKMKSPKDHRPAENLNVAEVLEEFLEQQYLILGLLERAREVNINKRRVRISIARVLKLKTGDSFRFLIAHEQRHFCQADEALRMLRKFTGKCQEALPVI